MCVFFFFCFSTFWWIKFNDRIIFVVVATLCVNKDIYIYRRQVAAVTDSSWRVWSTRHGTYTCMYVFARASERGLRDRLRINTALHSIIQLPQLYLLNITAPAITSMLHLTPHQTHVTPVRGIAFIRQLGGYAAGCMPLFRGKCFVTFAVFVLLCK